MSVERGDMKKFSELNENQKCIYQAFVSVTYIDKSMEELGKIVEQENVDADDDKAVTVLANHFGLNDKEMFLSNKLIDGNFNLEKNREYILSTYNSENLKSAFLNLVDKPDEIIIKDFNVIKKIQEMSKDEIGHTVYCQTEVDKPIVKEFIDYQKIYKEIPRNTLILAYSKP